MPQKDIYNLTPAKVQDMESPIPEGVGDFPILHLLPVFDFIFHFVFLTLLCSCVLFDSYVPLADDQSCKQCELFPLHVNQKSSSVFLCIV